MSDTQLKPIDPSIVQSGSLVFFLEQDKRLADHVFYRTRIKSAIMVKPLKVDLCHRVASQ